MWIVVNLTDFKASWLFRSHVVMALISWLSSKKGFGHMRSLELLAMFCKQSWSSKRQEWTSKSRESSAESSDRHKLRCPDDPEESKLMSQVLSVNLHEFRRNPEVEMRNYSRDQRKTAWRPSRLSFCSHLHQFDLLHWKASHPPNHRLSCRLCRLHPSLPSYLMNCKSIFSFSILSSRRFRQISVTAKNVSDKNRNYWVFVLLSVSLAHSRRSPRKLATLSRSEEEKIVAAIWCICGKSFFN